VGDELQTHLEPGGKFFRPFVVMNGNPTLTFKFRDGYKTTYIFGGAITQTALRPDIWLVEINATAATPQEATKANQTALVDLLRYILCKVRPLHGTAPLDDPSARLQLAHDGSQVSNLSIVQFQIVTLTVPTLQEIAKRFIFVVDIPNHNNEHCAVAGVTVLVYVLARFPIKFHDFS
jgi:hypothetical protein